MPEEIKGKFECSGENTEKYITFSVPIKKEIVINDDDEKDDDIKEEEEEEEEEEGNDCDSKEEEVVNIKKEEDNNSKKKKTITYKMQFIDSYRLMPNKLSDLVDNLSGFCSKECKSCMEKKLGWNVNLLDLTIIDWGTNSKNVEMNALSQQMKQSKIFRLCIDFAMVILIIFFSC